MLAELPWQPKQVKQPSFTAKPAGLAAPRLGRLEGGTQRKPARLVETAAFAAVNGRVLKPVISTLRKLTTPVATVKLHGFVFLFNGGGLGLLGIPSCYFGVRAGGDSPLRRLK